MRKRKNRVLIGLFFVILAAGIPALAARVLRTPEAQAQKPMETEPFIQLFRKAKMEQKHEKETASPEKQEDSRMFEPVGEDYFADALFIGDSRTVGLSEYGRLTEADYFANIGMSVFNLSEAVEAIPDIGKVTLRELLAYRQYGKIYLMLGINEIGYPFDELTTQYGEVVGQLREAQPDAILYVCANLHVAASRSETYGIYNNTNINRLNEMIASYADGESIFYIDVNEQFDDAQGNLAEEYTYDASHVLGKYYRMWGEWLCTKAIRK